MLRILKKNLVGHQHVKIFKFTIKVYYSGLLFGTEFHYEYGFSEYPFDLLRHLGSTPPLIFVC